MQASNEKETTNLQFLTHRIRPNKQKYNQIITHMAQIMQQQCKLIQEQLQSRKTVEKLKERMKSVSYELNNIQSQLNQQKYKYNKCLELLRQRENELQELERGYQVYSESVSKMKQEIRNLNEQVTQYKEKQRVKQIQYQENIVALQQELSLSQDCATLQRQTISNLQETIKGLQEKETTYLQKNKELGSHLMTKEEEAFQQSSKVFLLQNQLQLKNNEVATYKYNYDSISDSHSQIVKYNRQLEQSVVKMHQTAQQKQQQLLNHINELRVSKMNTESKVKTLQESKVHFEKEKSILVSGATIELEKLSKENKLLFESSRKREVQCRRLMQQVQSKKVIISKLSLQKKQNEDKFKHSVRLYESQIKQLKSKESGWKLFKQFLHKIQLQMQNEVRKLVGKSIKRLVNCFKSTSQMANKVIEVMKELENNVITSIQFRIQQGK